MQVPPNVKTFEGGLATFWLDEHGILYAVSKTTPRTLERQIANYELIAKITGNKKVCLLSDTTNSSPQDKETRDYMAAHLPDLFKAMAVISASSGGRFITNIFLALKQQPIPIRFFTDEEEAKAWLMKYL